MHSHVLSSIYNYPFLRLQFMYRGNKNTKSAALNIINAIEPHSSNSQWATMIKVSKTTDSFLKKKSGALNENIVQNHLNKA